MELAGKYLNLAGHKVGFKDPKVLYTCGDIEGHIGKDKRFYVLDFARFVVFSPALSYFGVAFLTA
jgi:hypothetical protein